MVLHLSLSFDFVDVRGLSGQVTAFTGHQLESHDGCVTGGFYFKQVCKISTMHVRFFCANISKDTDLKTGVD